MSGTSIAANVMPGPGYVFGAGGETMLSSSLQGAITSLRVRGPERVYEFLGALWVHGALGP